MSPICSSCSVMSTSEVFDTRRTAVKYPRRTEDMATKGRPMARLRMEATVRPSPSQSAPKASAPK